jgi:serine/threonine-protein kinase RsbW
MRRSLTIPADAHEMRHVRDFAAAFAVEYQLPDDEVARVLIILEELLTNTVKYGYPEKDCRGCVEISMELVEARLTIQFIDDAREFDPFAHALQEVGGNTDARQVGGLGLYVVRALAHEKRYRRADGRNIIQLTRELTAGPKRGLR